MSTAPRDMSSGGKANDAPKTVRVLDVTKSTAKEVVVPSSYSSCRVSSLMASVEAAFGVPAKRQRLICSGRIMHADDLLSTYKLGGGGGGHVSTIHLFPRASDAPPAASSQSQSEQTGNNHQSGSTTTSGTPTASSGGLSSRRQNQHLGQTDEDAALARQLAIFSQHASVDDDFQTLSDLERGMFDLPPDVVAADLGTPREFLWGFIMGAVLGFIMLLYLWERSVSHRQKMGILAGATAQLFIKYLHSGFAAAAAGHQSTAGGPGGG